MDPDQLTQYLHAQIPLSAAMQVEVRSTMPDAVVLAAPLAPNINHKSTVFGGSASAVAILAAWSILHVRLRAEGLACEVVIQSNRMDYESPIRGDFTASAALIDPSVWPLFVKTLTRRGRARIEVESILSCQGERVGRLEGRFVAFLRDGGL